MPEDQLKNNKKRNVSVIIPFYNRENFLAEAVESVLAQTYQNWELILVDDGSTDGSRSIAESFIRGNPEQIFVLAHENGQNRGASSSRNLGIKHATGKYITFLDSDDVFLPETLQLEIDAFDRFPKAEVICGTLQYWFSWAENADKKERDFPVNLGLPTEKLYKPPALLIHNLRAGGRKPGIGCVILKTDVARKFALFEDDFKYVSEDQIFWAKVSLNTNVFVLKNCLAKYRQHPASSSSVLMQSGNAEDDWEQFSIWLEKYLTANKIEDREIRQAVQNWKKENSFRFKYKRLMSLYHKFLPFHVRYRIRDLIIRWRTGKHS